MRKQITEEQMAREVQRAKRFNDIAFIITVLLAVMIALVALYSRWQHTFSSRRWKDNPDKRSNMVYSLLQKETLYAMERKGVIELLGYDQHHAISSAPNELTYYLGSVKNPSGDRWLILELKDDIVDRYYFRVK